MIGKMLIYKVVLVAGRKKNLQDYPGSKEDFLCCLQMEVEDHADSCFVYGSASPDDYTGCWPGK